MMPPGLEHEDDHLAARTTKPAKKAKRPKKARKAKKK